jgi:hypothetical protein
MAPSRASAIASLVGAALTTAVLAQPSRGRAPASMPLEGQGADRDFAQRVKEWTTRPDFSSPLVDHLPRIAGVPSPKDVLGHHIGEPKKLTYYADILKYYRSLAAASPRAKVLPIGTSSEGRELVVVFVGSEESIRNLDTYRGYLAQLADPRRIDDRQARDIVAKAKPIYHLSGGLHSGEVGPSEMLMELAYRLVAEDSALVKAIRDHVIVSMTPVADPDGRDRNVDWYYEYGVNETEGHTIGAGVPYWGKYIFHDDNRDINYSQPEMRSLLEWYLRWHPPIMHDLHQSQTLLYTFSGQAPQNPNLDPILYGELPMMANFEMAQMAKYGMPGVWTHGYVDMWSPGYLAFMSSNHNGMVRMYEIQGNSGANTTKVRLGNPGSPEQSGGSGADGGSPSDAAAAGRSSQAQREWFRPWPATGEFDWSLRNNINYGETGVLTALQYTAAFSNVILENFYQKSKNSITAGRNDRVVGYVIPAGQADMTRVAQLVNLLRMQGIEVGQSTVALDVGGGAFPPGSYVVKRDQPYGRLARTLLEKQSYPDATTRTYDDSAWTMGLMSQVDVREITDRSLLDLAVTPVQADLRPPGSVVGTGRLFIVAHAGSNNMVTLRWRLKDLRVQAIEKTVTEGSRTFPPGSFVIDGDLARVRAAVEPLGLSAVALGSAPDVPMHDLDLPRVAVYSTWGDTQDVGWVRYTLDHFEVPYDLIFKERVRRGQLRTAYDVIVVPNQAGSAKRLVFDIESRGTPVSYRRTDRFSYLGVYGESDDITGGMGLEGVAELERFVKAGGVLVTLGAASFFPADFGVAPRVDASRPSPQFYAPGPLVDAEILKPEHPIFYGYHTATIPVRYANGPLLTVQVDRDPSDAPGPPPLSPAVLMRFPGGAQHVLSGLMRGANEIRNRPAIVDRPSGDGRVILFATNPCYRWENFGEFNLLFNTLLNFNDMGRA